MTPRRLLIILLLASLWATLLPAVAPVAAQAPETNVTVGCVDSYDPEVDYFPEKTTIEYADNLTVEYFNNYKVITINQTWPGAEPVQYVLVQCGTPAPEGFDNATVLDVPASTLVTMATTFLPFVVDLGLLDNLVGHDNFSYVSNEAVRARIDAGELTEVGEGAGVSVEVVLDLDPSLILASSSGMIEYDAHPALVEAGLPVALTGDWMEATPLGRAEWIKFVALFYNREAEANRLFTTIAEDYQALVGLAAQADERPTVFTGSPWQGTWYVPGGQSFSARLLADAGADYLWANDESTGSLFLDFEAVFDRAADADIWVNAGGFWFSLEDALAEDERFAEFAAFQNGQVWSYNLRLNEFGGNDFFESGIANPNLVLGDLIAIFHPDLLPDHQFVYYRQLQ